MEHTPTEISQQYERDKPATKNNPRTFSSFLSIWLGLLMLTGVTILVAGLNLGSLSVLGAILLATVESILVVFFFMNNKYEDKVFKVFLGVAILILVVILLITFAGS